ncbi:MAG: VirB8/TrbF family protein [Stenotrophomonas chelatiphaga]|jgi:type IV secretion system protein VirB8
MFRKKDPGNSPKVEQAVAKAVSYEITVADMARKSERRAWWVAGASLVMSLALAGGYYYVLPLKEKVPFLVMADAYTGTASVARLSGNLGENSITSNEAINRSNVAQYVLARESYDYAIMGLRDWEQVFVMSDQNVGAALQAQYNRSNPQSPLVLYGTDRALRVKILSITPLGALPNGGFRGASVRIQRTLLDKRTGGSSYLDNQLVTLQFEYKAALALNEQERVLNPLSFQVTEYRVDRDYAAAGVPVPDGSTAAPVTAPPAGVAAELAPAQPVARFDPVTGQPLEAPAGSAPGQVLPAQPLPPGSAPGQAVPSTYPPQPVPAQGAPVPGAPAQAAPGQGTPLPARNVSTGTADGASNR